MPSKDSKPIPRFITPIVETHCHLDYLTEVDLDDQLRQAAAAGVERFITIAVSDDNLTAVLELTKKSSKIWGTQGIHPHQAAEWSPALSQRVVAGAADPRIIAIGEIGLDYFYDHADRAAQKLAFEDQLAIAADLELPVVIHTRDADVDTRQILENALPSMTKRGVIHSFTSSMELAEFCLDSGFFLGFNGICTFKNADNVREVVELTPLDRILLETDSPYLTPVPYRGRVNSPKYLPFIAEKVAEIKKVDIETLLAAAKHNSEQLFFGSV